MTKAYTTRFLSTALLGPILALMPAGLAAMPERFPIRVDQVIAAIGIVEIGAAEVHLLSQLSAATAEPLLDVREIAPWGERGAYVRMGCRDRKECLPFYVSVLWPSSADAHAAMARTPGGRIVPASGLHAAAAAPRTSTLLSPGSLLSPAIPVKKIVANDPASRPVLRSGSRATLLLDGARLHIQVPVVCLEGGDVGQTIRVSGLDHKQTYRAEVIDSTLLKGLL